MTAKQEKDEKAPSKSDVIKVAISLIKSDVEHLMTLSNQLAAHKSLQEKFWDGLVSLKTKLGELETTLTS